MTPEEIVQQQVNAYNSRNIDAFVACHHPDVELFNFSENTPFIVGTTKVHTVYQDIFNNSPNLHTEILHRIVLGNRVIDHERITGRKGVDVLEMVAIYEIADGLIRKAHFMKKNPKAM